MANEVIILTLLVLMFGILGCVVAFAANRRLKSKVMIVKDLRNPNLPEKKYYARYDKKTDMIYLYSNLFKPFKDMMEPPFNMEAYLMHGVCYCLRGVTGHPEDKNIVPIRRSVVGKTGANEFSNEISGAIVNTLEFVNLCKPFKVGQEVEFADKHKGKEVNVKGQILRIGYEGIVIGYDTPTITKDGTATVKRTEIALEEHGQIAKLKSMSDPETVKRLHETPLGNFFDATWVMTNFGVTPVDDVNAVLESEKSAVAQFNSNIDSRRMERMSWAARHGPELLIITFFAVSVIMGIIYWNAVNTNILSQVAAAHGANPNTATTNSFISGLLPTPVTKPS